MIDERVIVYMDVVVGKIYKLLPIYEEKPFDIFHRNVMDISKKLAILYEKTKEKYILELILDIECLRNPTSGKTETKHQYVARKVFESINTAKKIKETLKGGDIDEL